MTFAAFFQITGWPKTILCTRARRSFLSWVLKMGQVVPFARRETAFDPDATSILIAAYEAAIESIEARMQPRALREIAARRIIALAARGERSPERLCAAALATIGRTESAA